LDPFLFGSSTFEVELTDPNQFGSPLSPALRATGRNAADRQMRIAHFLKHAAEHAQLPTSGTRKKYIGKL
jgi:hypothetical protein